MADDNIREAQIVAQFKFFAFRTAVMDLGSRIGIETCLEILRQREEDDNGATLAITE